MILKIAFQLSDSRDHKHLATAFRHAASRMTDLQVVECPLAEAEVVILRRGDPDSVGLIRRCEAEGRLRVVIYTSLENESHRWILRWPARTADVIQLMESLTGAALAR